MRVPRYLNRIQFYADKNSYTNVKQTNLEVRMKDIAIDSEKEPISILVIDTINCGDPSNWWIKNFESNDSEITT